MTISISHRVAYIIFAAALVEVTATGIAFGQSRSAGDLAQARELLSQGRALREHRDFPGAIEKLRAADALAHTPITAFELGRTYLVAGKLVEARETFLSVSRIAVGPEETERSNSARAESDKLAADLPARIPSLNIRVTGVPLDTVAITIDGAAVPTEVLAAPRLVNPGSHILVATSTTGGRTETAVDIKEGETREVELKLTFTGGVPPSTTAETTPSTAPSTSVSASPADGEPRRRRSNALEWSLLGGGVAIAAAGTVTMAVGASQSSNAAQNYDRSSYDSAKTIWTTGLIGVVVGGAALAGGAVLFALPTGNDGTRGSRSSLWIGASAGDVRVGGSW
jgi:hypothetical protein